MEEEICTTSAHRVCSIEDLLSKILAGLPLGSLRLSKSVCKRWLHLITGPSFNLLRSRRWSWGD
uniref:Putative F-box domain-containing protein n=1 Tax=Helianthus annuus TaxID=4232 RepID=A0A251UBZ1_HELAN